MNTYRSDAISSVTLTKRFATDIATEITRIVMRALEHSDITNRVAEITKRERKDRPSDTPPMLADSGVIAAIIRGAVQAGEPFHNFAGIRGDLLVASSIGARSEFCQRVLSALDGADDAAWALASLERARDVLCRGKDRGPNKPSDVLYRA